MDGDRFDNMARALASGRGRPTSRRAFLAGLAGGALAAAGLLPTRRAEAQVSQAYCGNVSCKNNPGKCKDGCVCCVQGNGNARCMPPGACSGTVTCPAGQVANPSGVCVCVDNGTACAGRACGTAVNNCGVTVTCGPLGGGCPNGQSCQAGACVCPAGTCGNGCALALCPDGSCKQGATGACAADGDCCSGICVGGVCLGGCVAEGGTCDSGPDCCAGACVTPGGGGGSRLCCSSGTACGANCCAGAAQVCDPSGACCTPNSCQPGQCGPHADGCGRGLDCGGCTEPGETCGGGGTPGVCGSCTPADPATVCAGMCGTIPDGCGSEIECSTCGGGLHCCNGACVNLANDVDNCRECGRVCESNPETCTSATCVGGNCVFSTVLNCCQSDDQCADANPCTVSTCDPRTLTCRHDPDPSTDNTPCGTGKVCCAGACIDVSINADNCGACGNTCVENQPCEPCPPGQLCPDRGPGCCESGTCSAGQCTPKALTLCGTCATAICDPELGSICVNNCPSPPDICHTGPGTCRLDGTCVYPPKCDRCHTCDPVSGMCSPKVCGPCEECDPDSGQCVSTCSLCETCDQSSGTCLPKACLTCEQCDEDTGQCVSDCPDRPDICFLGICIDLNGGYCNLVKKDCGTCRVMDSACNCSLAPQGTSCGLCQVCSANGTCELGAEGTSCGTCRICSAGQCTPAPQGTRCGDGRICDGRGECGCALQCGPHCCPDDSVSCCVIAGGEHPDNYTCCRAACTPLPPSGSYCSA